MFLFYKCREFKKHELKGFENIASRKTNVLKHEIKLESRSVVISRNNNHGCITRHLNYQSLRKKIIEHREIDLVTCT